MQIASVEEKPIDKLVEECSENIDEKDLHSNEINDYQKICSSCSVYMVLLVIIFFILSVSISSIFIYFDEFINFIKANGVFMIINNFQGSVILGIQDKKISDFTF